MQHETVCRFTHGSALTLLPRATHRKRAKGNRDKVIGRQPPARLDYNANMGGVDTNDQYNSTYKSQHRPRNFFWRRVFDHFLFVAVTNAYLLYRTWATGIVKQAESELARLPDGGDNSDVVQDGPSVGLTRGNLRDILVKARKLARKDRAEWVRELSIALMSHCTRGNPRVNTTPPPPPRAANAKWEKPFRCSRECNKNGCNVMTRGACRCWTCTANGMSGVVICGECFRDEEKHKAAAADRCIILPGQRKKQPIPW